MTYNKYTVPGYRIFKPKQQEINPCFFQESKYEKSIREHYECHQKKKPLQPIENPLQGIMSTQTPITNALTKRKP